MLLMRKTVGQSRLARHIIYAALPATFWNTNMTAAAAGSIILVILTLYLLPTVCRRCAVQYFLSLKQFEPISQGENGKPMAAMFGDIRWLPALQVTARAAARRTNMQPIITSGPILLY